MSRYNRSIYQISKILARVIPTKQLIGSNKAMPFLPFWHVVSDYKLPHIDPIYTYFSISEFEKSIEYILKHYNPVSLETLFNQGKKPFDKPSVHFSFDDGLKECAEIIAPILLKKGIPATFFINSAFIDNKDLFSRYKLALIFTKFLNNNQTENAESEFASFLLKYKSLEEVELNQLANSNGIDFEEFLKEKNPYMTLGQLKELEQKGFQIGGHSHNHLLFSDLKVEEQIAQISKSMAFIAENLNQKIKAFAFPFTDDQIRFELFEQIKAKDLLDISFGTAGLKEDKLSFHFQRVPMEGFPGSVKSLIKSENLLYRIKKLLGTETVKRI